MSKKVKHVASGDMKWRAAFFIVLAAAVGYFAALSWKGSSASDAGTKKNKVEYVYNEAITEADEAVWTDEAALYSYVKKFGPKRTMEHLHALSTKFGDCHETAHRAGRFSYDIYDAKAFKECSAECHSGCYHGATEAYFRDHGTANLQTDLQTICSSELNAFFSHQCLHGIGHGLMAWANYELPDALKACDLLDRGQSSCWTGVFMENIVGGLGAIEGHKSNYLNDDPLYPCNDANVGDQYRPSCYFLQTSRMMQLFLGDFKKIADACSKAPELYQRSCFESMGRDVGGVHRLRAPVAIAQCQYAPKGNMRIGCLIGAAQDTFWDPSGQDNALGFCKLLTDTAEKDACYGVIFGRAPEVLGSKEAVTAFCKKAEATYQDRCMAYAR
ncbi:MAG: hypothetical protein AAB367_00665 [Patescibacteria group bacterium]